MNATTTRRAALAALAVAATAAIPAGAFAQAAYPNKTVTIVVPFAAGGTTDILARIIGQALTTELGQPVIVDNRAGAGGNIGGALAAKAPADGYTLFMGTVGTHAINASLYKKMPFDPIKDFAPLTRVANVPNLLVANPAQPYKSWLWAPNGLTTCIFSGLGAASWCRGFGMWRSSKVFGIGAHFSNSAKPPLTTPLPWVPSDGGSYPEVPRDEAPVED